MDILSINVLSGPNYWSNYRKKLIALKLDLQEFEYLPTNKLIDFTTRLTRLLPSLYSHRCSRGRAGGFFERLEEGTWLGHVIEHVALELQSLAGMDCGFGRTYSAQKSGVYHVIFTYEIETAGIYAAHAALALVSCLAYGNDYLHLEKDIKELQRLFEQEKLGPSTQSLVNEAKKRNIPFQQVKDSSLIILGQGCKQKKIWATLGCQTSAIGTDIVADKELTKQLLASNFIPVPKGLIITAIEQLDSAIEQLSFPLVIKPHNGNHGRGITTNIFTREKALTSFMLAKKISKKIIIEPHIQGDDYRLLLINYQLVAAARRVPATIIGDGYRSVQELIDSINAHPKRGMGHENILTMIDIDEVTLAILAEKKLTLKSILAPEEQLFLKDTANLSSGGTAIDVTDEIHPTNKVLAERIARLVNLDICGIDIITHDIGQPLTKKNGAVIEVNAGPGFRMHLAPTYGQARNVAVPVFDMLYPFGSSARIPIVAVTGTNGKTTVVRLLAHIATQAKYHVGLTSTEGIYIDNQLVFSGDCSGPVSAKALLGDPLIDFAVLECARGGILRAGLGFDQCDISIITNVSPDHLGLGDIHTLEELADVKAVVAYTTKKDGFAILNADDDLVYRLKKTLQCHVALFAIHNNDRLQQHYNSGGMVAYVESQVIVVYKNYEKYHVMNILDIPITFQGTASCMIKNTLPVILASIISNISLNKIISALRNFLPNGEHNPGRMNTFTVDGIPVMVDYAHNEYAYRELEQYMSCLHYRHKIGILAAAGDRRELDIQNTGYYAAQIFDEVIIRHNKDKRGRSNEALTKLILTGMARSNRKPIVHVISDEFQAVRYALDKATQQTFIYYSVDNTAQAIDFIKGLQKRAFAREETLI